MYCKERTNTMKYKTSGVCCREISFDIEDGVIKNVLFNGGCDGNTTGISKLVVGMSIDDVITKLEGVTCGPRGTSCPDQLAKALKEYSQSSMR